jgi:hypothetical protein
MIKYKKVKSRFNTKINLSATILRAGKTKSNVQSKVTANQEW